jgi:hypothetical protein
MELAAESRFFSRWLSESHYQKSRTTSHKQAVKRDCLFYSLVGRAAWPSREENEHKATRSPPPLGPSMDIPVDHRTYKTQILRKIHEMPLRYKRSEYEADVQRQLN